MRIAPTTVFRNGDSPLSKVLRLHDFEFVETVRVIGNWDAVICSKCKFQKGVRVVPLEGVNVHQPKSVIFQDVEAVVAGSLFAFKISAAKSPTLRICQVVIDGAVAIGDGRPHVKDGANSGSPDLVSIQNVNVVELHGVHSSGSGENGFSINGCESVTIDSSSAVGNDGQGFHIGRHNEDGDGEAYDKTVGRLELHNVTTAGNWRNQLNVAGGSGCGVLLHSVGRVVATRLFSAGHEYPISMISSGKSKNGSLFVDGVSYDAKRLLVSPDISVDAGQLRYPAGVPVN